MSKNPRLVLTIVVWIALVLAVYLYAQLSHQGITELMKNSLRAIAGNKFAALILIAIFMLRPLLLLPVSILSAFSGYLFGPILGLSYALIATSLSASIAYAIAFFFSRDSVKQSKIIKNLKSKSFESVLISRLTFIPGDLVNYSAGYLKINYWQFLLATVLGGLPGLAMTVLAGAAIEGEFSFSGFKINTYYILASLLILASSLLLAHYLRRRKN